MDIAAFLARCYDEDEAWSNGWLKQAPESDSRFYARRILREAAAGRKILALADAVDQMDDQLQQRQGGDLERIGDQIRATLAEVFSDHPDYDQVWRPE